MFAALTRRLKTSRTYLAAFGLAGIFHIIYCVFSKKKKIARVAMRWSKHPLYLRLNSSDISVFRQVFLAEEYGIIDPASIAGGAVIDGGANIGLTSVFIADRNPEASIYAVEPDEANCQLLELNTREYPNVCCIRGALWGSDTSVCIVGSASEWAFQVEPAEAGGENSIPAFSICTLLDRCGLNGVALLKLDVEGAEWEILQDAASWVDKVENIVIELHEDIRPGCTALFQSATPDFDVVFVGRELTLASRRTPPMFSEMRPGRPPERRCQ
jgi:FkbM family methyltransferase